MLVYMRKTAISRPKGDYIMKKNSTVFILVLTLVMLLSLSACGGTDTKVEVVPEDLPVIPATTEAAENETADKDEPAANVDPAVVNMGQAIDELHTADAVGDAQSPAVLAAQKPEQIVPIQLGNKFFHGRLTCGNRVQLDDLIRRHSGNIG